MASPVDSARQGTNITTAATSHAINVGSPVAGTLLIVLVRFAAAPGTVTFTGYTQFAADTSDASDDDMRLYYRQADGAEGATDTLSTTNSVKLAAICWEITGAENPATTAPSVSAVAIGTAANINPFRVGGTGGTSTLVIDELDSGATDSPVGAAAANTRVGMMFAPSAGITSIKSVDLILKKTGSPVDTLNVAVHIDNGTSQPAPSSAGTTATLNLSALSTSYATYSFVVDALITDALNAWIVVSRSGAVDASNYVSWQAASNAYAGGGRSLYDGSNWGSIDTTTDLRFATYETVAYDQLFLTVVGLDSETATFTSPSGYSTATTANSGTGGAVATNCMIAGASKQATAVYDDPAAWTSSAPATGVTAWTIAIPSPAAAAAPGPAAAMFKPPLRRRASRYLTFR